MARGVNKVVLIGNLGKDPEVQTFDTYKKAAFSLATTEYSRDREGNEVQHTEWHNIVMWRTNAENAEKMLKKGMQIYVEGKIQSRQWNDKEGQKRNVTEIVADTFRILQKRENTGSQNPQGGFDTDTNFDEMSSKDLPF